jgi:hypothetical protein
MTKDDKRNLRDLCKAGNSFNSIRSSVSCADSTIKKYMKTFSRRISKLRKTSNLKEPNHG